MFFSPRRGLLLRLQTIKQITTPGIALLVWLAETALSLFSYLLCLDHRQLILMNDDISYLLNDLNDAQREAVAAPLGQQRVLAGAGSVKTRVLLHRIACLC